MCCNGVIFADVKLQPGDDPELLRRLGLQLKQPRLRGRNNRRLPGPFFCQPCAAFDKGRCRIYSDRPEYCGAFQCGLLKSMDAGRTDLPAALRVVNTAHQRANKVRRLLCELGDNDEQRALAVRFRQLSRHLEKTGFDKRTAELFGQLTLAVHDLNLLLSQAFYPGSPDQVG